MSLEALLMNKKSKARKSAKKAHKKVKKHVKKRANKKAKRHSNTLAIFGRKSKALKKLPKGTVILAKRPARSKKIKSARKHSLDKAQRKSLKAGGVVTIPRSGVKQFAYKINKKRRHEKKGFMHKRNPMGMSMNEMIQGFAGVGAAIIVPKYVVKFASMIPFVGGYIAAVNANPYGQLAIKAAIGLGGGFLLQKKTPFKTAGKAVMVTTGVIIAQHLANKFLGVNGLEGIELEGIEMAGIENEEMSGIENEYMQGIEEDDYMDGMGNEYMY